MKNRVALICVASAVALASVTTAMAKDGPLLPGDNGPMKMGGPGGPGGAGGPPPGPAPGGGGPMPGSDVPALPVDLAIKAVQAIGKGCSQYHFGAAIVNAKGEPILVYIPDGAGPSHGYTAIRKAYTAVTFNVDSSKVQSMAKDAAVTDKMQADANLVTMSGGLLIKAADGKLLGAIGVSGAEPGSHDTECGMMGLDAIKGKY
jgi:uncharacterized protein GlcG (DUF336 family)